MCSYLRAELKMMKTKNFYIGTLSIQIVTEISLSQNMDDAKFTTDVLPVAHTAKVDACWTETVPKLTGECRREPNMAIFQTEQEEVRVYDVLNTKSLQECNPAMFSRRSHKDKMRISLAIVRSNWNRHSRDFRPWFYIHLEELLLENQALILHAASIVYQGQAILFTAPSGTGKTTQTNLWHSNLNDVEDLNGDRTLLQKTENGWYACGFPICGSSGRCEQKAVPIKSVIIVRRGELEEVCELSALQSVMTLYSEITIPNLDQKYPKQAMGLLEDLVRNVPVIQYACTMNNTAFTTLYRYLYPNSAEIKSDLP